MKSHTLFILTLILFDGLAVAWGAWEFWSAREKKAKPAPEPASPPPGPEEGPGHPEG
jgi:hypothetical protein